MVDEICYPLVNYLSQRVSSVPSAQFHLQNITPGETYVSIIVIADLSFFLRERKNRT